MLVAGKSLDRVLGEGDSVGDRVSHFVHLSDIGRVLREALDQCVLVADGAALVFGMLLGPARYQLQFGRDRSRERIFLRLDLLGGSVVLAGHLCGGDVSLTIRIYNGR